ncbi:NADPH-dependent F420 reductase [Streptomyces polyrhachis]|uniref:NADPH-dependent F420 reductase n=1 Tax=Streptomyces polyrhachis TaxID=1282885 RepID=A0ABW2GPQ4_9ACTN
MPETLTGAVSEGRAALPARTAVLGCGRMGSALVHAARSRGLDVVAGVRTPRLRRPGLPGDVAQLWPPEAVAAADLVVLATPPGIPLQHLALHLAPVLAGKVVLDVSNPLFRRPAMPAPRGPYETGGEAGGETGESSETERLASWLPAARVAKAFNTVSAKALRLHAAAGAGDPYGLEHLSVPVVADDPGARETVCAWVRALGFDPVPAGGLAHARELEHLARLLHHIDTASGRSGLVGCRIVRPEPL